MWSFTPESITHGTESAMVEVFVVVTFILVRAKLDEKLEGDSSLVIKCLEVHNSIERVEEFESPSEAAISDTTAMWACYWLRPTLFPPPPVVGFL